MNLPKSWSQYTTLYEESLGPSNCYICRSDYDSVPLNLKPYLGNGFIATQPGSPWVFLDGLFNGSTTESHRACIPSPVCWSLTVPNSSQQAQLDKMSYSQACWMHFGMGVYLQQLFCSGVEVHSTTFVSRSRPGLLIRLVEAFFTEENAISEIHLVPDKLVEFTSPDCEIVTNRISDGIALIGSTRIVEQEEFQPETTRFYMYTNVVPEALIQDLVLTPTDRYRCYLTCVSRVSMTDAMEQYISAFATCREHSGSIMMEQAEAWSHLWQEGGITLVSHSSPNHLPSRCNTVVSDNVDGDRLPLIIQAAQYSLLTCLPSHLSKDSQQCEFFGLCPTGLARGNEEDDYMGHVFWDMEIWMLPWINLFHSTMCRSALDYRYFMLPTARYLALMENRDGARFPWESAFTGVETTPWKLAADNQIHNTGAVSFAVQQWLLFNLPDSGCVQESSGEQRTETDDWFARRGMILLEEVAKFWSSRMQYSEEKQAFEVLDVMPPDEYTHSCRNSAYTNAIASLSLAAPATYARRQNCAIKPEYLQWETRSSQLWMPRSDQHQLMLEHEDYVLGTWVKQADTILLTYPLLFEQPESWKRHMIDYYAGVTDPNGPAMTWSMFCICALDLNEFEQASDYFKRCLLHVKGPYCSWTETRNGSGACNFLTGAGGFLQSLVHGYCGFRSRLVPHRTIQPGCPNPEHQITVLYLNPTRTGIPGYSSAILQLRGIHFQGRRLHIQFNGVQGSVQLHITEGDSLWLGRQSDHGWDFDRVLRVGDEPVRLNYQPLCITAYRVVL